MQKLLPFAMLFARGEKLYDLINVISLPLPLELFLIKNVNLR